MKPLNLFDATAVPMYDVFGPSPDNIEPYDAIVPGQDLLERNTAAAANASLSRRVRLNAPDRVPQAILDRILWQNRYGRDSEPPPPGPNASGLDYQSWRDRGLPTRDEEPGEVDHTALDEDD
jgi:hypothetical protein